MTIELYAAYALVIAGVGLLAWTLFGLSAVRVNATVANEHVARLLRAGNRDRARKLCGAAPGSYFDAIAAAIDAANAGTNPDAAFDAEAEKFAKRWAAMVTRGWLGVLFVGGGLACALSVDAMPKGVLGIALAGGILATMLVGLRSHATQAIAAAKAYVVPEIRAK